MTTRSHLKNIFEKTWRLITILLLLSNSLLASSAFANCDTNQCVYSNIPFTKAGFYVAQVHLEPSRQEGFWGLSVNTSSGINTGGFNAGTVLKENGQEPGFMGFYLSSYEKVDLTVYEYSGQIPEMTVMIERQDLDTGVRSIVYGPTLMSNGGNDVTDLLVPGFYVASAVGQQEDVRGRFGISVLGESLTGGVNIGGWIDEFTGGTGEGFGAFYVASPQTVNLTLLFGNSYGDKGAGLLNVTVFYLNPVTEEREFYWESNTSNFIPTIHPIAGENLRVQLTDVIAATAATEYTSNTLVLSGLAGTVTATVTGGNATLVKNGIETGAATTTVSNGDTLAVTTRSATGAGNTVNLALQLGEKILPWSLTTASVEAGPAETGKMSGYTPVECEVSESGGAVCQLPLTAPAGTSGMAPKLSLGYNSQGNNGPLGVGWSLNGLSAITRCRATQAQDGLIDAVDFDAHDRFCLDGEKLMAVEGEYGAEGTIYYTEQHTFQKIVSFLHPETKMPQFKAWTKTGLILEYGFTADSSVEAQGRKDVMIWAVNKIQDTKGNYLAVSYEENNDNGEYYPKRIDYTGNEAAGLSPFASVQFFYEDRPDILPAFIGGSISAVTKRLSRVETWDGEEIYRKYSLAYEQAGAIQQSRLVSVQECGTDGGCFAPTTFSWLSGGENSFSQPQRWSPHYGANESFNNEAVFPRRLADVNGDGLLDIVAFAGTGVAVSLNTGSGFSESIAWLLTWYGANANWNNENLYSRHLADVNGDGMTDIVGFALGGAWTAFSTGSSFTTPIQFPAYSSEFFTNENVYPRRLADVSGDGMADIVAFDTNGAAVSLSAGANFSGVKYFGAYSSLFWTDEDKLPRRLADVNGDGLPDIVGFESDKIDVSLSTGDGSFQGVNVWLTNAYVVNTGWSNENAVPRRLADVNGDGLADIVAFHSIYGVYVSLSTGSSFTAPQIWVDDYKSSGGWNETSKPRRLADVNGDGLADIVGFAAEDAVYVSLSTGKNFTAPQRWLPGWFVAANGGWNNENAYPRDVADMNGDGIADVIGFAHDGPWVALSNQKNEQLLASVTNGHQAKTTFTYKLLTDTSVYTKESNAQHPMIDFTGALSVVSAISADDGIGGQRTLSYHYQGGKLDTSGRGFRGFSKITQTDEATGVQNITFQDTDYRYINAKVKRSESRLKEGQLLSETDNTPEFKDYGHGVYSSWVKQSVTKAYELDSSLISTTTTTTQYDEYNNPTQVLVEYSDGRSQTVNSTYTNDLERWILGRLSQTQVTNNVAGQGSQTRTSSFEYDPESGLLVKETIEPGQPLCVEKIYTHDAYGNVLSSTTQGCTSTALAISSRTQRSEYDTQCRYLLRNINALGHSETKQYQLGNQIALTGPNGLTTRWEYDGFGRVVRELRADGTWTQTSYRLCEGETHCPTNAHYFVRTDTAGSPLSVVYYDRLDRDIRKSVQSFDGKAIYVDSLYNARGEVAKVSDPYFDIDTPLWTLNEYDDLSRVVKQTEPDGSVTQKEYHGLTTMVINPLGQYAIQVKDVAGNLVRSEDSQGKAVTYIYDGFNNPVEMRDSLGNVTQMGYNQRGNKVYLNDPDTKVTTYTYNALGELLSQTDAKNQTVTFRYDVLGRLVERQEPEGTTTWEYDTAPKGIGSLAKLTSSSDYSETYRYDSFGRATETLTAFDGQSFPVTTFYDHYGRTSALTYPTSFAVHHIYNDLGYLQAVRRADNQQSVWQAEVMNARGQLEKQRLGNDLVTQRAYDPLTGHLQTIQTGPASNLQGVQNLSYRFDSLGNLLERRRDSLSETFTYDSLNRLVKSNVSGGESLTMSYDELGNITSKSDVGNYSYGQGAGPHAVTQAGNLSYTYNAVGNRIGASNGQQIQYTSFNKPTRIAQGGTTLDFLYSPSYDRYQQVTTKDGLTTTVQYVGSVYEQETKNGLTEHKHTILAGGESVAIYTLSDSGEENTRWLHQDHLGSVETMTDEQGNRVETLSFDAWGQRRSENWNVLTPAEIEALVATIDYRRGFTGHEHLDEVNLINMNGRIYDPLIGRFLSADPFIQFPEFTQSLNRYSYVLNNPLSFTDPSGFFSFKKMFRGIEKFFSGHWKEIVAIAAGALLGVVTGGIGGLLFGTLGTAIFSGAGIGFGSAFAGTLLNGGSIGQALRAGLKGGLIGGAIAGISYGISQVISGIRQGFYDFRHGGLSGMYNIDPTTGSVTQITSADQVLDRVFLNGMSNDLEGAILRGTQQNFGQPFTLLHNPTHGFVADLTESTLDKMSRVFGFAPSKAAQQVASLLQTGKIQFITGHSQGGLMLTRSLEILYRQGVSIPGLNVTFNGAAVNINTAMRAAYRTGAIATWNAHFTDLVPQVIGGSGNPISMLFSVLSTPRLFSGKIFGRAIGDKISPHSVYP